MKNTTILIDDKEYDVVIGENKLDNENVVKTSKWNDTYFHFNNISGPHIVLRNGGNIIPKRYLVEVAKLLFVYKKNAPKNAGVLYTNVKNVVLTEELGSVILHKTKLLKF